MPVILQDRLATAPWMAPHTLRLPGTVPVPLADWLRRDEVFAAQMAYRDRLIAERRGDVLAPGAPAASAELLALVLERTAHPRDGAAAVRPDGVRVPLDGEPLEAAGRLVQEDLLILEKPPGQAEHRLAAGILCFPSNWTLHEKLGMALGRIHLPVAAYDEGIARRVQRLFDGMKPLAPLMRANTLIYGKPDLYNPRREWDRHRPAPGDTRFVRVERQCLVKLPASGAVVFSIHTSMVRPASLTPEQRTGLEAARPGALEEFA